MQPIEQNSPLIGPLPDREPSRCWLYLNSRLPVATWPHQSQPVVPREIAVSIGTLSRCNVVRANGSFDI